MTRIVNGPGEARSPSSTATFPPFGSDGGASAHLRSVGAKYWCSPACATSGDCGGTDCSATLLVAGAPTLPIAGGSFARRIAGVRSAAKPTAITNRLMWFPPCGWWLMVRKNLRGFGSRGRQHASLDRRLEPALLVGPVAERLVRGLAAAAERDGGASGQVERLAILVDDLEIPLNTDGAVVANGDLGRHSLS